MKTFNNTNTETFANNSLYQSTSKNNESSSFPLLKFRQKLYNSCQNKFSQYASNKGQDIKFLINNKIQQNISLVDYLDVSNSLNNDLTPIPYINKRKLKNEREKKELKDFQRNVVMMRRLEYANKMREKNTKKKYNNKIQEIILMQKIIRGYLVRKVINQINIIKDTVSSFITMITSAILRKDFENFLQNLIFMINNMENIEENQEESNKKSIDNKIVNLEGNDIYEENTHNFYAEENLNIHKNNEIKIEGNKEYVDNMEQKSEIKTSDKNNNVINDGNKETIEIKEENQKEDVKINDNSKINNNINNQTNNNTNIIEKDKDKNNSQKEIPKNYNDIETNNINNISNSNSKLKTDNNIQNIITQNTNNHNGNNINNNINNYIIDKFTAGNNINTGQRDNSVIENDEYISFSNQKLSKDQSSNIQNKNSNNKLKYSLSDISNLELKRTKTERIQKQIRKYLTNKGFYGKFDHRKIAIVFLLKNILDYNIKPYVFNYFKKCYENYKNEGNITERTQEDNFTNVISERIFAVNKAYADASKQMNF